MNFLNLSIKSINFYLYCTPPQKKNKEDTLQNSGMKANIITDITNKGILQTILYQFVHRYKLAN